MIFQGTFAVRRLLRKAINNAQSVDDVTKLRSILEDRAKFDDLMVALRDEHGQHCQNVGAGGPFTDFLDWLLENGDKIIALIMKLLPLFV